MEDLEETVDINTASVDEFVSRLKGVGRSKAKAIVHFRTTVGKFKKLCELTYVPGITQCILERNQGVLFCVSNSNNLSKLHEINKSESSLEEGELSESSFSLTGESEVDNRPRLNGQHLVVEQDNITRRTRNWSLTPDINGNDHHLALTIDTPCTAYQSFQDCTEEDSNMNSSPVIQSLRSRSKSRNEERTMSTRSRHTSNKSKVDTAPESSTDSVGSRVDSLTLSSPRPNRGKLTRTKKTLSSEGLKTDRITTRHMVERARPSMLSVTELRSGKHLLVNNPDTQTISVMVQSKSGEEFRMDTDNVEGESAGIASSSETVSKPVPSNKLLNSIKIENYDLDPREQGDLSCHPNPLRTLSKMKRKLDSRSDGCKLQSPEKKACKSSLSLLPSPNAPLPTFGEFKAVTRGIGIQNFYTDDKLSFESKESESGGEIVPVTNVRPKASIKVEGLAQWLQKFKNWNPAERIAALDELIDSCEPRQVRYMLEVIEPQFQRDFISLLPKELALYVLSFLEPKDLLTAAQTCRYWHILTEDNLLWREKCDEEGINEPYYPKVCKNSWKCRKPSAAIVQPSAWKSAFLRQHRIEMNWRRGEHKSVKLRIGRFPNSDGLFLNQLLKGHDDHVITCLQFNGTRIVSGSDDNTLKVWSAVSGKCLRTLTGHTGGVWASQMRKNMIISGSTDRTLKIWNVDSGQCIHTLYGHTSTVRCMALHDNIVVSGSRDATLRVWDVDTGECLHVLTGHMAAVRCVCYDGKLVVSGAYDYMVKVWDPVKEECLHTLQGHTNRVYSLQFDGVHVVSGSLDTSIRVWSVETGLCLHTLVGHQSLTSGMELKNNILVSGNADSTVKMWDIITGDCLKTLEGPNKHQSAVTCLQFYGKFVVTSSDDGTVKLWDVKSGKAIRDLVSLDSRGSGGVVWRIRASQTKLVCAVGSRNGTEETKLLVLDFDPDSKQ